MYVWRSLTLGYIHWYLKPLCIHQSHSWLSAAQEALVGRTMWWSRCIPQLPIVQWRLSSIPSVSATSWCHSAPYAPHLLIHNGVACTQIILVVVHCVVIWISGRILNFQVASVAADGMRVSIFEYRGTCRQHPLKHDTCSVQWQAK